MASFLAQQVSRSRPWTSLTGAISIPLRTISASTVPSLGAAEDVAAPNVAAPSVPAPWVMADLQNCPKHLLKEELLTLLRPCNLTPERAYTVLDEKLRVKYWRLEFETRRDLATAREIFTTQSRLGSRRVALKPLIGASARPPTDPVNTVIKRFRDRSLLMVGVPDELRIEAIEKFFHGYSLAPMGVWHFWCSVEQPMVQYSRIVQRRRGHDVEGLNNGRVRERRTVVMFNTRVEALRALREKQGTFLQENSVDLRLIQ